MIVYDGHSIRMMKKEKGMILPAVRCDGGTLAAGDFLLSPRQQKNNMQNKCFLKNLFALF
ncbi:hypothetical protein LJB68_13135 [bacterium 210820-DFI.6.52]|nr:hypothetical protein [bacterium 210820-DFI.6.52]